MSAAIESSGRDYGQEAIKRRLGFLAKRRREQLGLSRVAFAKHAGTFDQAVQDFEFAKRWPRSATLRKFEDALGWKVGITEDILFSPRAASSIEFEDVDSPAILRAREDLETQAGSDLLKQFSTPQLMEELIWRLGELKNLSYPPPTREELYGKRLRAKPDYDLAASHNSEHLEDE